MKELIMKILNLKKKIKEQTGDENKTDISAEIGTKKISGIRNLGKTCYINSVLQCLFASKHFNAFLKQDHSQASELKNLLSNILTQFESSETFIDPKESIIKIIGLLKLPGINNCKTEGDPAEFFRIFANIIHKKIPIKNLVFSVVKTNLVCHECKLFKKNGVEEVPLLIIRKSKDSLVDSISFEYLQFKNLNKSYAVVKDFSCKHEKEIYTDLVLTNNLLVFEITLGDENEVFIFKKNMVIFGNQYRLVGFIKFLPEEKHYIAFVNRDGKYFDADDDRVTEIEFKKKGFKYHGILMIFYERSR